MLLFLLSLTTVNAFLNGDLSCTRHNGTAYVYSQTATSCQNAVSDAACMVLYPPNYAGAPLAGTDNERPLPCYSTHTATPAATLKDMKTIATNYCAKTCGFCCLTSAYACSNAPSPALNCSTISPAMCLSPVWRPIIAKECPNVCGFCDLNGCIDAVVDCANDPTICKTATLQDFVKVNCKRTCNLCDTAAATTKAPGGCTYQPDATNECPAWAAQGFCDPTMFTPAQQKEYCATTCKIC